MQALMNWFTGSDVLGDPDAMLILTYMAALDSIDSDCPVSPVVKNGEMFERMLGIPRERAMLAFARLIECGEVTEIDDPSWRGFRVARLTKLADDMRAYSRRPYRRRVPEVVA